MKSRAPAAGDSAPPLQLPTVDGDVYDLTSLRGRYVMVSFLRHAG